MKSNRSFLSLVVLLWSLVVAAPAGCFAALLSAGANVNISYLTGNQHESTISIDPSNPQRMFAAANLEATGNFVACSTNGGATWNGRIQGAGDGLPSGGGDVQSAWDRFGNLFLTYIGGNQSVIVLVSTNGGVTFSNLTATPFSESSADQPSIAAGSNSVWVSYASKSNVIVAAGASISGLGAVGSFTQYAVPGSAGGNFGDIAVGPAGQVLVTYQYDLLNETQPDKIVVNLNPTGIGGIFGNPVTVATTQVGGSHMNIPAQSNNMGIDAEANLAWDRSGGPHHGRVHLAYTDAPSPSSSATDIYTRYSDNNGASWSAPIRVTDDTGSNSKFLPSISVDQTSGAMGVAWYDCRNDNGQGTNGLPGDTDGIANNDAQLWATVSTNGGASFLPNIQVSAGTSHAAGSEPPPEGTGYRPLGFGDFNKSDFHAGNFFRVWADNSNSTGNNPDGALSRFDIYTAAVSVNARLAPLVELARTATNTVRLSWPAPSTGWALQQNANLNSANWLGVTNTIRVVGTNNQTIIPTQAGNWFFRLAHP